MFHLSLFPRFDEPDFLADRSLRTDAGRLWNRVFYHKGDKRINLSSILGRVSDAGQPALMQTSEQVGLTKNSRIARFRFSEGEIPAGRTGKPLR
jgi:hypothetical protein